LFVRTTQSAATARALEYDPETALSRLAHHAGPEPCVIGQLGQSLDGRIATPTGASKYINGQEALAHLHRLRARVHAVLIGVGTAVADDPQLTTRHVPGPDPVRVVLDPRGRLPDGPAMLSDGAAPVISITCRGVEGVPGTETLPLPCNGKGRIDPRTIIQALAKRGLTRLLVEGGAETLAGFLDADAIDELHLMLAPIVLGSGKTGLNLSPIRRLDEALRPLVRMMRFHDGDMLCMCDLDERRAKAG